MTVVPFSFPLLFKDALICSAFFLLFSFDLGGTDRWRIGLRQAHPGLIWVFLCTTSGCRFFYTPVDERLSEDIGYMVHTLMYVHN